MLFVRAVSLNRFFLLPSVVSPPCDDHVGQDDPYAPTRGTYQLGGDVAVHHRLDAMLLQIAVGDGCTRVMIPESR